MCRLLELINEIRIAFSCIKMPRSMKFKFTSEHVIDEEYLKNNECYGMKYVAYVKFEDGSYDGLVYMNKPKTVETMREMFPLCCWSVSDCWELDMRMINGMGTVVEVGTRPKVRAPRGKVEKERRDLAIKCASSVLAGECSEPM